MIISKGLLVEFVNITNLYGFEIDNNNIKNKYNIFGLKPVGAGRIQIINIVYENNIYKTDDTLKLSIEKMCSDYSKAENRNEITDKFVCEILQYYIGYYISLQTSDSVYGAENNIIYLLEPLYEMIEKSNEWIISFWELLKTSLTNKNNSRFASAIIKDTLKFKHIKLAKYLPNQLCKLAEYFWTYEEYKTKDELYRFNNSYLSTISNSHLWGLNKNSDDYSINNFKNSPITSSFFFNLFITNYFDGLKWSIQFINKLINNYVKNEGDSKSNINLYFVEQNKQNVYYGDTDMWCAGTKLSNVPTIINDIIFCLKEVLFLKLIDEKTNIANKKSLLNQTREIIYEESNNIIMLSVVSDIGKLFHKNFPGYSIDLISSINLVNFDLEKMAGLMPLPLTDKLEKQIFLSVGISNYSDRYKSKINIIFDVRNYAIYCQLQKDITIRKKCYKILDYLYSIIENNDENLNDYFQLEQMDVRKASCKYKGDGFIEVTPNIAMNTSKTFDNYNKIKSEAEIIEESVKSLNVKILDGEYKLKDITDTIETILTHSEDKYLKLNVEATKIELIAFALSDSNLDDNLRNKYCLIWIEGLEDCIQNNTFIFEQKLIPVLIEQTKKRINKNSVRRIEKIILECILRREFSGVINNMYYYIYKYLINNKELVLPLYNTIIALAFEEPKIYKYRHNNDNKYFSKISNIISKYLYDKEPLIHKTISSANYEFDTLFRCFDTGVSLEDQGVYDLARRILKKFLIFGI